MFLSVWERPSLFTACEESKSRLCMLPRHTTLTNTLDFSCSGNLQSAEQSLINTKTIKTCDPTIRRNGQIWWGHRVVSIWVEHSQEEMQTHVDRERQTSTAGEWCWVLSRGTVYSRCFWSLYQRSCRTGEMWAKFTVSYNSSQHTWGPECWTLSLVWIKSPGLFCAEIWHTHLTADYFRACKSCWLLGAFGARLFQQILEYRVHRHVLLKAVKTQKMISVIL